MTFIRNAWYVAAYSREIGTQPFGRTIVGDPVVMFRDTDGKATALLDVCTHRFAPLSKGTVTGGRLQCPYHGLEFNAAGRCVLNPHGNGSTPPALDVRTYPLVERDSLIWIWTGAPALADRSRVPDYSYMLDAKRKTIGGYARVASSYRLIVDNLMDLAHAQFLHRSNLHSDVFAKIQRQVRVEDGSVFADLLLPGGIAPPLMATMTGLNVPSDNWLNSRWIPVGAIQTYIATAPIGTPIERSFSALGSHILTPETEASHHYFFSSSRNFRLDDAEIDEMFVGWQKQALVSEDQPIVEAIEARAPVVARYGLKQTLLSSDEAAIRVSRMLDAMEEAEAQRELVSVN